jgi:hypothetical protein
LALDAVPRTDDDRLWAIAARVAAQATLGYAAAAMRGVRGEAR